MFKIIFQETHSNHQKYQNRKSRGIAHKTLTALKCG